MSFQPELKPGDTINNQRLMEIFQCGLEGGMRRSLRTNTLVLVSDHTTSLYEDRWIGNIFHYTGMGQRGDQKLDRQNKTLAESTRSGVEVHLFEVFVSGKYIYIGRVELTGEPYKEEQPDIDGNLRHVWVFPLRLVDASSPPPISNELLNQSEKLKEKVTKKLTDEVLYQRVKFAPKSASTRQVLSNIYERNPYVAEYAKRRAEGICQLCRQPAPFKYPDGRHFLEVHHIEWLSEGGTDTIDNTVALCPNCHRKMHVLNLNEDRKKLRAAVSHAAQLGDASVRHNGDVRREAIDIYDHIDKK